jgi:hypothetical protein
VALGDLQKIADGTWAVRYLPVFLDWLDEVEDPIMDVKAHRPRC